MYTTSDYIWLSDHSAAAYSCNVCLLVFKPSSRSVHDI